MGTAAGVGWCCVLWCKHESKRKKNMEISNSNDRLLESCNFGSCIHWCCFGEVDMLPWYKCWKAITSTSHCPFPSSLPKILQHFISTEEVIHRYMHVLTVYMFSLVRIFGISSHKKFDHVNHALYFPRSSCSEWCFDLKKLVTRCPCIHATPM